MKITHRKNRHRAALFMIKRVNGLSYRVKFDKSCRYDTGKDQWDWLKLFGIKKRYFQPQRNSIMGAWRYNPGLDVIEIGEYEHDHTELVTEQITQIVKIGQWSKPIELEGRGWLSLPWFGGTSKAPHKITFEVDFLHK